VGGRRLAEEVYVCPADGLPEGQRRLVTVDGTTIGVFRQGGHLYAYENQCVHQGGPVCYGQVVGKVEAVLGVDRDVVVERFSEAETHLVCPWHGYEYDLRTGECAADRRLRLRRYQVLERGADVYVVV
jgi:nitrite reductase (NADH) small subunit